ncbi:MAG TPA: hypothetical protein DCP68_04685 [Ruminococcus sp.]|nr:hypothetical protein [Ruminococcus sp.]
MSLFRREKPQPVPEPFTADDIRMEESICTGERTIGFYDKKTRRLRYAELVRTDADITRFYRQYGLIREAEPETLH